MPAGPQHDGGHRSPENMAELDFSAKTLMDEVDMDGWLPTTRPVGEGRLNKLPTAGARGLEDRNVSSDTRSDPRK